MINSIKIFFPSFSNYSIILIEGKYFFIRIAQLWFILLLLLPSIAFSYEFPPERTVRAADKELGWMFAPLPGCVEE